MKSKVSLILVSLILIWVTPVTFQSCIPEEDSTMIITYKVYYPTQTKEFTNHIKCNKDSKPRLSSLIGTNRISISETGGLLISTSAPIEIIGYRVITNKAKE